MQHPFAFRRAADDICYRLVVAKAASVSDIGYEEVSERFFALIPEDTRPKRLHEAHSAGRRVQLLRDIAIGRAIEECAEVFLENEPAILSGKFDVPLIDAVPLSAAWEAIQQRSIETIYATTRGVEIEAAVRASLLDILFRHGDVAASNAHHRGA